MAYTDDDRADAVALYLEHGLAEAHHRTGTPKSTLRVWLRKAGHDPAEIDAHATGKTAAAVAASTERMAERRVALRQKLLTAAEHAVDQVTTADSGSEAKGWAVAGGIVIDKLRLELGEATERHEHGPAPERTPEQEAELAKVVELAERRDAA